MAAASRPSSPTSDSTSPPDAMYDMRTAQPDTASIALTHAMYTCFENAMRDIMQPPAHPEHSPAITLSAHQPVPVEPATELATLQACRSNTSSELFTALADAQVAVYVASIQNAIACIRAFDGAYAGDPESPLHQTAQLEDQTAHHDLLMQRDEYEGEVYAYIAIIKGYIGAEAYDKQYITPELTPLKNQMCQDAGSIQYKTTQARIHFLEAMRRVPANDTDVIAEDVQSFIENQIARLETAKTEHDSYVMVTTEGSSASEGGNGGMSGSGSNRSSQHLDAPVAPPEAVPEVTATPTAAAEVTATPEAAAEVTATPTAAAVVVVTTPEAAAEVTAAAPATSWLDWGRSYWPSSATTSTTLRGAGRAMHEALVLFFEARMLAEQNRAELAARAAEANRGRCPTVPRYVVAAVGVGIAAIAIRSVQSMTNPES